MFICKGCHGKGKQYGCQFDDHYGLSYGACEICRKTDNCVDCKCYKRRPASPNVGER
jgi:hypothetical protein